MIVKLWLILKLKAESKNQGVGDMASLLKLVEKAVEVYDSEDEFVVTTLVEDLNKIKEDTKNDDELAKAIDGLAVLKSAEADAEKKDDAAAYCADEIALLSLLQTAAKFHLSETDLTAAQAILATENSLHLLVHDFIMETQAERLQNKLRNEQEEFEKRQISSAAKAERINADIAALQLANQQSEQARLELDGQLQSLLQLAKQQSEQSRLELDGQLQSLQGSNNTIAELQHRLDAADKQRSGLIGRISEMEDKLFQAQQLASETYANLVSIETAKNLAIADLQNHKESLEKDLQSTHDQIAILQVSADTVVDLSHRLNAADEHRAGLIGRINELENKLQQLASDSDSKLISLETTKNLAIADLQKHKESLEKDLQSTHDQISTLKAELKKLYLLRESLTDELGKAKKEIRLLNDKATLKLKEEETLRSDFNEASQARSKLQEDIIRLRQKISTLESALSTANETQQNLKQSLKTLSKSANESAADFVKQKQTLQQSLEVKRQEILDMIAAFDVSKSTIGELNAKLQEVTSELATATNTAADSAGELKSLQALLQEEYQKNAIGAADKTKQQLVAAQAEIKRMTKVLETSKAELDSSKAEITGLKLALARKEQEKIEATKLSIAAKKTAASSSSFSSSSSSTPNNTQSVTLFASRDQTTIRELRSENAALKQRLREFEQPKLTTTASKRS
jgi:chromosome segregation ATPase